MEEQNKLSTDKKITTVVKQFGQEHTQFDIDTDTGCTGFTKIEIFYESGQMAAVPWIRVYKGDHVHAEFDATYCVILYEGQTNEPPF